MRTMLNRIWWIISALSAPVAAIGIALGAAASADPPDNCTVTGNATVCDPSISAPPPSDNGGQSGSQNGPYGPSGDTPPVGGN